MTLEQIVPVIVPVSTAITTIVAILIPVLRSKTETRKRLDEIESGVLQLMLHDTHLPESERLKKGKKYLDLGGNGASAVYYKELEARHQERIKAKLEGET